MNTCSIAPADLRDALLGNDHLDLAADARFLRQLLTDQALPAPCIPPVERAIALLGAALAQLEAAATIAETLAG